MNDQLPEEINEDFLNDDFTDIHEEMMERTNQHTDPVQTPHVQPPSLRLRSIRSLQSLYKSRQSHSTGALPHLSDTLGDQLTHQNASSSQQPTLLNLPQISTISMSRPMIKIHTFTGDPMKLNT